MAYRIADCTPCSICGLEALHHHGWFLLVDNRWLDRLKILTWHPILAAQKDVQSACCRQHLKILITHWINESSLSLSSTEDQPMPITSNPTRRDLELSSELAGQLLGELSVHREAFSCAWTGSQTALDCILDALIPAEPEAQTYTMELELPPQESAQRFAFHQSAGRPAL